MTTIPRDSVFNRRRFLKRSAVIATGVVSPLSALWAEEPPVADLGSETQLFLDDWIVESMSGLRRTLQQPAKKGLIKEADGRDWESGDVYMGNIVCKDSRGLFHMTYRYGWWDPGVRDLDPNIGDDKAHWQRYTTGYAFSEDGIHWHKPKLGLIDGPTGFRKQTEFPYQVPAGLSKENNLGCPIDFIYDLHAHGNIQDRGKRFLLRVVKKADLVYDGDHLIFNRDGSLFEPGFIRTGRTALATFRWDGYVSLDAGDQTGHLVTRPVRFQGKKLSVNLAATKGSLRVELQDAGGKPIQGFTASECNPISADNVEQSVSWRGRDMIEQFAGKTVRLRCELTRGSLYAFRFA